MFENCPDIMTVRQVSDAIGFSRPIVYELLHRGAIRHFKVHTSFRVPKNALIEFIEAGGIAVEAIPN